MNARDEYFLLLRQYLTLIRMPGWHDGRLAPLVARMDQLFYGLRDLVSVDGVKRSAAIEEFMRDAYLQQINQPVHPR